MGGKGSKNLNEIEIICPKCPLTPIISIFLNKDGILSCEYRCPFMHFGQIPFEDIKEDKENKHGKFCDRCVNSNKVIEESKDSKNKIVDDELLYCGTCRQFICKQCREAHDKEKESHKILVPKSKLRYTCLEHNKKYIGYCFTCLIDVCEECTRHNKHCKKLFEEFYPDKNFFENYDYYIKDFDSYINCLKKSEGMNKEHFRNFKRRCDLLLNFVKYLKFTYEQKAKKDMLNGEILINFLNVVCFDYNAETYDTNEKFVKYCKTHLILSNRPISDICTFSKTKADYNISKLEMMLYKELENIDKEIPEKFKYSEIGNHIVYSLGTCVYFISVDETKENNGFKIRLDNKITSINIINGNILCVCSNKIFFYQLSKSGPYYTEYKNLPILDIFHNPLEIIGNLNTNLVIRTKNELAVVNDSKKKGSYEVVAKVDLEDVNTIITEKKEIDVKTNSYYNYGTQKKTINVEVKVTTTIKAIFNEYLVSIEKRIITTRNLKDLKVIKTLNDHKCSDCLVFNGNVMIFNAKDILFYSIPNLEKVSTLSLFDNILSLNIVNRKTFIVLQKKYIEQFETRTWKRISRFIKSQDFEKQENYSIVGAGKKLFLFDKNKKIFNIFIKKQEEK